MPIGVYKGLARFAAQLLGDAKEDMRQKVTAKLKLNSPVDTGALRLSIEVDEDLEIRMNHYGYINNVKGPHRGWIDRSV